jgi:hypothetical protein
METGTFTLYGAFCPASDPTCVDDGTVPQGTLATADYTATVAGAASLPEPSSFLLLLAGIGGMAFWGWLRGKDKRLPARFPKG